MTTPAERPEPSGAGPDPAGAGPESPPRFEPNGPPPESPAPAVPDPTFEARAEAFGERAEDGAEAFGKRTEDGAEAFGKRVEESAEAFGKRAEALGHEAEAAAQRWSSSPVVKETADAAGRLWGIVLLAVGIWFFADVTLGLRMPAVAWRDLWPLLLIVFGGFIVLKGMTRRA